MPRARTNAITNVNPVNAAETVAATLPGISVAATGNIDLFGYVDITTGASTTAVEVAIERGAAAAGTLVGTKCRTTVTAGNRVTVPVFASDVFAGDVAGQQYVLTVAQIAGTANGTVNGVFLWAIWP